MRRPCLSEWRMLRIDGFRRRRSWRGPRHHAPQHLRRCVRFAVFLCEWTRRAWVEALTTTQRLRPNRNRLQLRFQVVSEKRDVNHGRVGKPGDGDEHDADRASDSAVWDGTIAMRLMMRSMLKWKTTGLHEGSRGDAALGGEKTC